MKILFRSNRSGVIPDSYPEKLRKKLRKKHPEKTPEKASTLDSSFSEASGCSNFVLTRKFRGKRQYGCICGFHIKFCQIPLEVRFQ